MTFTRHDEVFPGARPEARVSHIFPGTFLVVRRGLILVETDSRREAHILAEKRGDGAFVTDWEGVSLERGR